MKMRSRILSTALALVLAAGLCPALAAAAPAEGGAAPIPDRAQLTVQAKKATTFKVVFKPNGGKGAMKPQTVKRDTATALSASKFTRAGYRFAGWNTKADGKGKTYKNKAKVRNLAKAGKTVTLYAQWKKAPKKASYLSAYRSILSNALARTGDFSWYKGITWMDGYTVRQYALWDINKDGIKELIVQTSCGNMMSSGVSIYTIKNGKAKRCGMSATGAGTVVVSSKGKLYIHGYAGAEFYKLIKLKGTKATEKTVWEAWPSDSDYGKKKRVFEKKTGLVGRNTVAKSGLAWSDIANVRLLKNADKAK